MAYVVIVMMCSAPLPCGEQTQTVPQKHPRLLVALRLNRAITTSVVPASGGPQPTTRPGFSRWPVVVCHHLPNIVQ